MKARRRVKTVGLVAKPGARLARHLLREIVPWLRARRVSWVADLDAARLLGRKDGLNRQHVAARCDLMIVFGGDGTLLSVARSAAERETPILGVNLGGLGFLTGASADGLLPALGRILDGARHLDRRSMLEVALLHGRRPLERSIALNDVVVSKKSELARTIDLAVEVNGRHLTAYKADGMIVATTTGSTAYSLSAGGPILAPELEAFVLNPICPHTLTHRPIVLPDTVTIEISLETRDGGVFLTLDGQAGYPVRPGDRVRIRRAGKQVALVRGEEPDYFHLLRSKLKWGEKLTRTGSPS